MTHGDADTTSQPATERMIARLECRPPPLPTKYGGRLQFYGYHIKEAWVMAFREKQTEGINTSSNKTIWSAIAFLLLYLQFEVGYRHVHLKCAIDDENTPPEVIISTGPTGVRQYPILILTAWEEQAWYYRPNVEQVEAISKIMEMEPQWYVDAARPESYHPDNPTDYD